MKTRSEYLELRGRYEPKNVKLVIIAESPPQSGKYFYDPTGSITEALFSALMKQLSVAPTAKDEGLSSFQQRGWVLVDATYEPVNKERLSKKKRDAIIARDYFLLRDDLIALAPDRSTPVILLKKNVCHVLEPKLTADKFNVLNNGRIVYFPSHGRQKDFHRQFKDVVAAL